MPKFSLEKIVGAGVERTFDAFADPRGLQDAAPRHFTSVRVLSARGGVSVAEVHLVLAGKELVMMTKHVADRPRTHEVFVIGGNAKGSHIVERYSPAGQATRVEVDADLRLDAASRLAGLFGRGRVVDGYSEIVDDLAAAAER